MQRLSSRTRLGLLAPAWGATGHGSSGGLGLSPRLKECKSLFCLSKARGKGKEIAHLPIGRVRKQEWTQAWFDRALQFPNAVFLQHGKEQSVCRIIDGLSTFTTVCIQTSVAICVRHTPSVQTSGHYRLTCHGRISFFLFFVCLGTQ